MFIEKNIPINVIKEINLLVTSNYFEDRSGKTWTQYGYQTPNIINLFDFCLISAFAQSSLKFSKRLRESCCDSLSL